MENLYFSKSCLLLDCLVQPGDKVSIQLGTVKNVGTVIFTEYSDPEFKDSDYFGVGRFLLNKELDKDFVLSLIKKSSSNREVYIKIIQKINERN